MGLYAGKRTPGICDRCSRRVPHSTLREEVVRGRSVGNLVCRTCYDEDHPQNWVGSVPVSDKQSVRDAQPEPDIVIARSLWGFNPICGNVARASVGLVTVVT